MKGLSMFKELAGVLVLLCSLNTWGQDNAKVMNEEAKCEAMSKNEDIKSFARTDSCRSLVEDRDTKLAKSEAVECVKIAQCFRDAKRRSDDDKSYCRERARELKTATDTFSKTCSNIAGKDCLNAARNCEKNRNDSASSKSWSSVANTALTLYSQNLNPGQTTLASGPINSPTNTKLVQTCPQYSFKSYFDRKEKLEKKIDEKTKEIEKAQTEIEKRAEEATKAEEEALKKIKDIDKEIAKIQEDLNKANEESQRDKLKQEQENLKRTKDLTARLNQLESTSRAKTREASTKAMAFKEKVSTAPSDKENSFACMAAVKTKVNEFKAVCGKGTGGAACLNNNLNLALSKCKQQREAELRSEFQKNADEQSALRETVNTLNSDIAQAEEELLQLEKAAQSLAAIEKQAQEKASQKAQIEYDTESVNRKKTLEVAQNTVNRLKDNSKQNSRIEKLRQEIAKAEQELQLLGPVPPEGYEMSGTKNLEPQFEEMQSLAADFENGGRCANSGFGTSEVKRAQKALKQNGGRK